MSDWSFACPDWVERLKSGRSLVPDLPLDDAEAERAAGIFSMLRLPDVPGQPAMADAAGEWQRDIVKAVFGSLDENGNRRVPELFALVPKKNSKTTGGAGIMMTALLMNKRPRAEFILVGPTQEVADLAFQQASGMIDADPDGYLQKRFQVQEHLKTIVDRRTKAKLKVKTFDLKVMTGAKPAGILVDELHLMSSMSFASRVIGQIRGGTIANPEAFLIFITTQSDAPPAGVFKSELQYARGVRDGTITENVRLLPVLYEFPESMQIDKAQPWANPDNWPMVLPNLGRSITIDRLISDYRTAKEKGVEEERRWASQHLNVEIGMALHSDRWIGADFWQENADKRLTLDYIIENSDVCVVGGDVGGLYDLWGLSVIGRHKVTRHWMLWTKAWAQPSIFEYHKEIAEKLRDLERDGDLVICQHVTQDAEEAAQIIVKLRDAGKLPEEGAIGLDPAGVTVLLDELANHGIVSPMTAPVKQGYALSGSIFGIERKLADKTFMHSGSELMNWCVGNASAEMRSSNIYIDKRTASAKIDPLVATFNAAAMMSRNPEAKRTRKFQMLVLG